MLPTKLYLKWRPAGLVDREEYYISTVDSNGTSDELFSAKYCNGLGQLLSTATWFNKRDIPSIREKLSSEGVTLVDQTGDHDSSVNDADNDGHCDRAGLAAEMRGLSETDLEAAAINRVMNKRKDQL